MIQINCTNCKALLQIDDAFAGGVCRCRYCGTIQTVPKHLKDANGNGASVGAAASASVGSSKTAKTLYQKKRSAVLDPGGGSGSGLDDLAGIVASSGLSSARLQKKAGSAPVVKKKQDQTMTIVLASAGGLVVLLLGIIIFMALKDRGPVEDKPQSPDNGSQSTVIPENNTATANGGTPTTPQTNSSSSPAVITTPNFLGQPLTEKNVVYVIDRGSASQTEGRLELAKQALLRSVRSLGSNKKFAVVFWYMEGNKPMAFPPSGLKPATPENINELQEFFDQIYVIGQTKTSLALDHACKAGAEAVVLVPMKILLDDGFVNGVMTARGKSKAKLYCVTLEQPDLATWLKKIASSTHGAYRDVPLAEARRIASGG
jgi:hypothetical protein